IMNPAFPQADFDRLQKQRLAGIQREKTEPVNMALRVFPALLYGKSHAYGNLLMGSGIEQSVTKLTRLDMQKFHDTWYKSNYAILVVVGDTTLKDITPKLNRLFSGWKSGTIPTKNIQDVPPQSKSVVYLIDRPGSIQSVIFAGHVALPKSNPHE